MKVLARRVTLSTDWSESCSTVRRCAASGGLDALLAWVGALLHGESGLRGGTVLASLIQLCCTLA